MILLKVSVNTGNIEPKKSAKQILQNQDHY